MKNASRTEWKNELLGTRPQRSRPPSSLNPKVRAAAGAGVSVFHPGMLSGIGGLSTMTVETQDNLGNWLTDTIKKVVPSHTVVGKLLNGDAAGAVKDATRLVNNARAPQFPPTGAGYDASLVDSLAPQNNTQKMLLIGAGALALGLVFMRFTRR
jgi:hypothetical protein